MSIGCTHAFNKWNIDLKNKRVQLKSDIDKLQNLEDSMNMGLRLSKLTKMGNDFMAPFLLNDMTVFLIGTVCWCYCAFSFFFNLDLINHTLNPLFMTFTYFGFTIDCLLRIWNKCNFSQELLNARSAALKELKGKLIS